MTNITTNHAITYTNKASLIGIMHQGTKCVSYWLLKGGGGAATGMGEGALAADSFDIAEDQDESSLGLTSVVSPTGYSRTSGFLELGRCCMKATCNKPQYNYILSFPQLFCLLCKSEFK